MWAVVSFPSREIATLALAMTRGGLCAVLATIHIISFPGDVSTAFHSAQHDTWWRGVKLRFCAKIVAVATATLTSAHCREPHARFLHLYRAENLYYQFKHGQELLPQLRQIICLLARFRSLFSIVTTIIARACFACRLDSSLRSE